MRKESVLLEDEPDGTVLGTAIDSGGGIEPHVSGACDRSARGPNEPCDRTQNRGLARPGRTDERNRLRPRLER